MRKITKIERARQNDSQEKLRVAAYIRVSTSSTDQLQSLEVQREHYEKLISERDDWQFVGIYSDEGISGRSLNKRIALKQLLADCEKGQIDLILTKSISRLARNTTDCLEIVRFLQERHISIYFEKENIHTSSMESELMLSILSSLAESESTSISENINWSIKKRFETGSFIIGTPAFGYQNRNGEIVVVLKEAELVAKIFELYLTGLGDMRLTRYMNAYYPNQNRGKAWTEHRISSIITNDIYTGDVLFQKTFTNGNSKQRNNDGQRAQYLIEEHHEAIISRDTFEKAKQLRIQWARSKGNGKDEERYTRRYELSSKVFCGECGQTLRRRHHYHPDYIAWTCQSRLTDKTSCSLKFVRDDDLKCAFMTLLNKLAFGYKEVLLPFRQAIQSKDSNSDKKEIIDLESQLEALNQKEKVVQELRSAHLLDGTHYQKELNDLTSKRSQIKDKLHRMRIGIGDGESSKEALNKLIDFVSTHSKLTEYNTSYVADFLDKIEILDRETVAFHLTCGLVVKERL